MEHIKPVIVPIELIEIESLKINPISIYGDYMIAITSEEIYDRLEIGYILTKSDLICLYGNEYKEEFYNTKLRVMAYHKNNDGMFARVKIVKIPY